MKINRFVVVMILAVSLSACGGSNNKSSNNNQSTVIEPTETSIAASEANADASSDNQAEQPAAENSTNSSGHCYNEYYPIKTGASWDYTLNSSLTGTDSFTRSILDTNDGGFTDQDAWAAGTVRTGSWSCDNGNLTTLSLGGLATVSTSEQTFVATSQESSGITYPSPMETGASWSQQLSISGDMVIADGMSGTATVDATQSCTAVGEESVTVPAGTFTAMKLNCNTSISTAVDIEGMAIDPMDLSSTSEMWLAKGVGMVKTVDNNEMVNSTIELSSYAIP